MQPKHPRHRGLGSHEAPFYSPEPLYTVVLRAGPDPSRAEVPLPRPVSSLLRISPTGGTRRPPLAEVERSDLRNDPTPSDETPTAAVADELAELAELRRENARLRDLLGLDQRTAVGHQSRSRRRWRSTARNGFRSTRTRPMTRSWPCCGRCSGPDRMCTRHAGRAPHRARRDGLLRLGAGRSDARPRTTCR